MIQVSTTTGVIARSPPEADNVAIPGLGGHAESVRLPRLLRADPSEWLAMTGLALRWRLLTLSYPLPSTGEGWWCLAWGV